MAGPHPAPSAPKASGRHRWRATAVPLAVALFGTLVVATPTRAEAHTPNRNKVVLFIHGIDVLLPVKSDCSDVFNGMIGQLKKEGFTDPLVKVGYYEKADGCDVYLGKHAPISRWSSFKTIGKALSHYIYKTFTSKGIAVDIVGHSMGGLIARSAVYGSQKGEAGFAPPIDVEDVVTLGSPHKGATASIGWCALDQCDYMKKGSATLEWLNGNGNPQGLNGTDWTNIGSYGDQIVDEGSATSMSIPGTAKVVYENVDHTGKDDYMDNKTCRTRTGFGLQNRFE